MPIGKWRCIPNYCEVTNNSCLRALRGSLAESPETVVDFLNALTNELKPRAARDFNTMRNMKKRTNYVHKVSDSVLSF